MRAVLAAPLKCIRKVIQVSYFCPESLDVGTCLMQKGYMQPPQSEFAYLGILNQDGDSQTCAILVVKNYVDD